MSADEARCALTAAVSALAQQSKKEQVAQAQLVNSEGRLQELQELLETASATVQVCNMRSAAQSPVDSASSCCLQHAVGCWQHYQVCASCTLEPNAKMQQQLITRLQHWGQILTSTLLFLCDHISVATTYCKEVTLWKVGKNTHTMPSWPADEGAGHGEAPD